MPHATQRPDPSNENTRFKDGQHLRGATGSQFLRDFESSVTPEEAEASLNRVVLTEELKNRPRREPNYSAENRALVDLAQRLASSPVGILERLAQTAMNLCHADSAGISLLDSEQHSFYWPAIVGALAPHLGEGTPRDFGPCGIVLDRNAPQLISHPERHFIYLGTLTPKIEEVLLVPFYVEGKAVGTVWVISHDAKRHFDVEDLRVATTLADFAAAAYQQLLSISAAKQQVKDLERANLEIQDSQSAALELMRSLRVQVDEYKRKQETLRKEANVLESEAEVRARELEERNAEVTTQAEKLRGLSQSLMKVQDEERRHIARELHDSAGQLLTVLGMNLAQLANHGDPELTRQIAETQGLVNQLTQEIRTTSYLLHPPLLDDVGLAASLRWYVNGLAERSNLDISLSIPENLKRYSPELELVIFRVVQECLTNIHRHSNSGKATIRLTLAPGIISVSVQDYGQGIPSEKLAEVQSQGHGVGIRGMRERVHNLGGELIIRSDGSGTTVVANLPVAGNLPS
jgi:signal transduction histidine kinase